MLKNKKIIFIILFFLLFSLFIPRKSFAAASSDLSSLTELQQETIKKTWELAISELSGYGHTLDTCYYFVVYSTEYDICHVIMINKEKSTDRQILNKGSFDWANMYHCKPNEEPIGYLGGINTDFGWSCAYSSTVGSSPVIIANNVTATSNQYNEIRTYEDVSFLKSEESTDTPTETPQIVRGTIAPVAKEMKMETTLQEIIQILPLIIVVVVSLVGLRKGLTLLLTLLHKA